MSKNSEHNLNSPSSLLKYIYFKYTYIHIVNHLFNTIKFKGTYCSRPFQSIKALCHQLDWLSQCYCESIQLTGVNKLIEMCSLPVERRMLYLHALTLIALQISPANLTSITNFLRRRFIIETKQFHV